MCVQNDSPPACHQVPQEVNEGGGRPGRKHVYLILWLQLKELKGRREALLKKNTYNYILQLFGRNKGSGWKSNQLQCSWINALNLKASPHSIKYRCAVCVMIFEFVFKLSVNCMLSYKKWRMGSDLDGKDRAEVQWKDWVNVSDIWEQIRSENYVLSPHLWNSSGLKHSLLFHLVDCMGHVARNVLFKYILRYRYKIKAFDFFLTHHTIIFYFVKTIYTPPF